MSHTPHELTEEFPEDREVITQLKTSNAHFAKLADEYHALNREIHRIESEVEPASDDTLTGLRKKRLALVDELSALIRQAKAA